MRFMVMHYSNEANEAGIPPGPEVFEAVGAYMSEMAQSGVFLLGEGVGPSSLGARLEFDSNGDATVTDGPFAEAKEQLGGFWIITAPDLDAALKWAAEGSAACGNPVEVRPFQDEPEG
jgi:hypothetical protein